MDSLRAQRRILRENRDKLDRIVEQLLIRETLDEPDVYAAAGIERPARGEALAARSMTPVPAK